MIRVPVESVGVESSARIEWQSVFIQVLLAIRHCGQIQVICAAYILELHRDIIAISIDRKPHDRIGLRV